MMLWILWFKIAHILISFIFYGHGTLECQDLINVHHYKIQSLAMVSPGQLRKEKFVKLTVKLELINALQMVSWNINALLIGKGSCIAQMIQTAWVSTFTIVQFKHKFRAWLFATKQVKFNAKLKLSINATTV